MCESLCSCQFAKRGQGDGTGLLQKGATFKWIHRLPQDLLQRLVMSQMTADQLFRPTGKKTGVAVGVACNKKAHNF